jgi:ABC-type phosphate transport system substrate-binding protein
MSQTTSAPNWGVRAVAAGFALLLAALAATGFAAQANADFTTGKCAGLNVTGEGGSFAKDAQTKFNESFKTNYCIGTPGFGLINVTYSPEGSGAGIASMTSRIGVPRFGGSDDPPTPTQVQAMNAGTASATDNGKIHVFPIAVGSVVALVNFPDGCSPEALSDQFRTVSAAEIAGTPAKKALLRVRFPKPLYEEIWAGGKNAKWSEAFPELAAQGAPCEKAITRVVRFDASGTTFTLKDYLRTINPARGWTTTYESGTNGNREWPGAEFGVGAVSGTESQCGTTPAPGGKQADAVDHLTSNCAKGNGQLIAKLVATDGSIGYSDLATARNNSPTLAVDASLGVAPTTPYWTQVQNGSGQFKEPTADEANGFKTAAGGPTKGSNCLNAEFKNPASSSFGDWSATSAVNSNSGWGICTLTYALVFDDNAAVWGNTPEEEAKARTVKDYEESILAPGSQGLLFGADYAPLPAQFLALSQKAVSEIGWNKSSAVTPPGGNPGGGTTPGGGGGGGTTKPSNRFSVPRTTISSKKGTATLSVKLPGAGKFDVLGTAKNKGKKVNVGHVILTVGKAGTYSVTLKPSGAAKALLTENGKLKVALKLTFTPTGGDANTSNSTVTLKLDGKK